MTASHEPRAWHATAAAGSSNRLMKAQKFPVSGVAAQPSGQLDETAPSARCFRRAAESLGLCFRLFMYEELEPITLRRNGNWEFPESPGHSIRQGLGRIDAASAVKSSGVLLERGAKALGFHPQVSPMAINSQVYNGLGRRASTAVSASFSCANSREVYVDGGDATLAEATGRCEIRPGSYVARIEMSRSGRPTGVT